MQKILGVSPAMMRPPYGSYNENVIRVAGARNQSSKSSLQNCLLQSIYFNFQSSFGTLTLAIRLLDKTSPSPSNVTPTSPLQSPRTSSPSTTTSTTPPSEYFQLRRNQDKGTDPFLQHRPDWARSQSARRQGIQVRHRCRMPGSPRVQEDGDDL
jgi:hypothetical protein